RDQHLQLHPAVTPHLDPTRRPDSQSRGPLGTTSFLGGHVSARMGDPPLVNQELLAAGLNRPRPHDAGLLEVLNERMGLMTTRDEAMAHKKKPETTTEARA